MYVVVDVVLSVEGVLYVGVVNEVVFCKYFVFEWVVEVFDFVVGLWVIWCVEVYVYV